MIALPWAFFAAGLGGLAAGQVVGWVVTRGIPPGGERVIVPGVLSLVVLHNQGIAFGLLGRLSPAVTVALALTVLLALFYNKGAWPGGLAEQWGYGLMVGGALGNVADRLRFGYVVDYLDVHVWPVFNLADAAIVVGAGVLAAASLARRHRGDSEVRR
ncbi:MAG TPA: signal peptidase II [bacterium]|nr:signal peptidase II [bacterium]